MPPFGQAGLEKGYDAESAITKCRAVKWGSTAEGVTAVTANTDRAVGVSLFTVATADLTRGKGASLRRTGIAEWEAGGAITKGANVTIDASGRCVAAATTNRVYGVAEQAAVNSGDVIAVAVDFINVFALP